MHTANADILIVEDDADIRESLSDFLSDEGYKIHAACNGLEALKYLEGNQNKLPSLIFLDLMMPVMDGHTFLKSISGALLEIPVIIVSAVINADINHNIASFMKKPVDLDEVIAQAKKFVQPKE